MKVHQAALIAVGIVATAAPSKAQDEDPMDYFKVTPGYVQKNNLDDRGDGALSGFCSSFYPNTRIANMNDITSLIGRRTSGKIFAKANATDEDSGIIFQTSDPDDYLVELAAGWAYYPFPGNDDLVFPKTKSLLDQDAPEYNVADKNRKVLCYTDDPANYDVKDDEITKFRVTETVFQDDDMNSIQKMDAACEAEFGPGVKSSAKAGFVPQLSLIAYLRSIGIPINAKGPWDARCGIGTKPKQLGVRYGEYKGFTTTCFGNFATQAKLLCYAPDPELYDFPMDITWDEEDMSDPAADIPLAAPSPQLDVVNNNNTSVVLPTVEVLPPPQKPAKEPVTFEKMKKEPQGLVSGTGLCTSINDNYEFVSVDCGTAGSIELIYVENTKQVKLVKKEDEVEVLEGERALAQSGDMCLQNGAAQKAKFVPCATSSDFQWNNGAPGQIVSVKDSRCLNMPTVTVATNQEQISTENCADDPAQQWKFQVKPSKSASSHGDPHFKTFSGAKFDFHGGCDLVLFDNKNFANGLGMTVHIRTKINTWWSYIESAVLKIGDSTLELMGGTSGAKHWINGEEQKEQVDGAKFFLSGFPVTLRAINSKKLKFRVDLGNGDAISMENFKDFVSVNVRATSHQFKGSVGMMGSFPSGQMLARDRKTIMEDADAFGHEWQVLASEPMMFHTNVGSVQPPESCAMPDKTTKNRRRLGEILITAEDASSACSHAKEDELDACIFDVLATNDKDMAGAY